MMICQTCHQPLTTGHFTAMILGERFRCHVGCEPIFYYEEFGDRRHMDQKAFMFYNETGGDSILTTGNSPVATP